MASADKALPRRKLDPIKVYCLEGERDAIAQKAKQAGLSASSFLRRLGENYVINSVLDHDAVRDLARINADLGRLGGLLKAILTNEERFDGYSGAQLQQIALSTLEEIQSTQRELRRTVEKLTGK